MRAYSFWAVPYRKKKLVRILTLLIAFFLLILFVRSCRHPGRISSKEYLKKLSTSTPEVQIDGLIGLAKSGRKSAIPDIEKVLSATSEEKVQKAAVYSIYVLDRGKFLALFNSPKETIRIITLQTLVRQEKEKAYPYLQKGLSDPYLSVRRAAFSLLTQFPGKETNGTVLRLAEKTGEDTSLRIEALTFLGKNADSDVLPQLKTIICNPFGSDPAIREATSNAIKEIESKKQSE